MVWKKPGENYFKDFRWSKMVVIVSITGLPELLGVLYGVTLEPKGER